eukprot:4419795-Amphidinium_carterae.1
MEVGPESQNTLVLNPIITTMDTHPLGQVLEEIPAPASTAHEVPRVASDGNTDDTPATGANLTVARATARQNPWS